MGYFEAFLFGALQGLTEYLPISSSAHLILLPKFMSWEDPGLAFDVFLHLGTLLATLIYFRKDWAEVWAQFLAGARGAGGVRQERGEASGRTVFWPRIAVATVPALVVGALIHGWVEEELRGNAVMVASLTLGALLLVFIDFRWPKERGLQGLSIRDALWVGCAQCLALVPGVSRSGITITAGRFLGFSREAAARFSFLISAPVTAAALAFELRKFPELLETQIGVGPLLVAGLSSFAFGWIAIDALLKIVRRVSYLGFAVYRVILAAVIWFVLGV